MMPRGEPTTVISTRLTQEFVQHLEARAKETGRSIGDEVREIIEAEFDEMAQITFLRRERRRKQFLLAILEKIDRRRWYALLTLWSATTEPHEIETAKIYFGDEMVAHAMTMKR